MSQFGFANLSSPLSGQALVDTNLEPAFEAIYSGHSGNSRPSYLTGGGMWVNKTTNPWILNLFDGTDDIAIGTINITSNIFTSASAGAATGVSFNNAASGLTATTVQAALDEIRALFLKAKGTSIASAGTTNIGAADSDFVSITGTTTITSLGSGTKYNHVWVQFDGALLLTHNATSLILPGGVNILTAAGDVAEFARVSGSNWKCLSYQRANGQALNAQSSGRIIQRVSGKKTDTASAAPVTPGNVFALGPTVAIAAATGNIVRLKMKYSLAADGETFLYPILYKDGSPLAAATGDTRGSRARVSGAVYIFSANRMTEFSMEYDDIAADTSSHTYELRFVSLNNVTHYINRSSTDTNANNYYTAMSYINAEEIGA